MNSTFAINLTRARMKRGYTMEALANKINISKQAVSHYENGLRYPDSKTLISLANTLEENIDFFFNSHETDFKLLNIRYREGEQLSEAQRNEVENFATAKLNDYMELEIIAKESIVFENPLKEVKVSNMPDAELAGKTLRKKWKLGDSPIHNVTDLLEKNGIRIIKIDFGFNYFHDGLSGWAEEGKVPVIIVNERKKDGARIRLTVLHELGHLLLEMDENLDTDSVELICDAFAGAVLLPSEVLIQEFGGNRTVITMTELIRIRELYGISISAIMVRAKLTKLISFDAYMRWRNYDFGDYRYGHYDTIEEPQRFMKMLYKCLGERKIGFDKAAQLSNKDENELKQEYNQQQLEFV